MAGRRRKLTSDFTRVEELVHEVGGKIGFRSAQQVAKDRGLKLTQKSWQQAHDKLGIARLKRGNPGKERLAQIAELRKAAIVPVEDANPIAQSFNKLVKEFGIHELHLVEGKLRIGFISWREFVVNGHAKEVTANG